MKFMHPVLGLLLIPSYGGGQAFMTKNRILNFLKTTYNKKPKRASPSSANYYAFISLIYVSTSVKTSSASFTRSISAPNAASFPWKFT